MRARIKERLNNLYAGYSRFFRRFNAIIRTIELAAILIAIFAFFTELTYRHEEREARAWQLLIARAPGNSGKVEALEYLHKRGAPLRGIDLTPPEVSKNWNEWNKEWDEWNKEWDEWKENSKKLDGKSEPPPPPNCPQYTYLRDVNLVGADLQNAILACSDLTNADLRNANLLGADFRGANLHKTNLQNADLRATDFQAVDLRTTNIEGANFDRVLMEGFGEVE